MQKSQMFIIILQKICAHICVFRYFFVSLHRVRQLVAMVHTTPLNGRAPNASALRSDYRYTSSPPENINKSGRGATGRPKAYRTGRALQDGDKRLQDC